MSAIYRSISTCVPSRDGEGAYIYQIIPTVGNGLAAITSANELLVLDRQNLSSSQVFRLADVPQTVCCLVSGDELGNTVICSGSDGTTSIFDIRSQARAAHFKTDRAVTALACNQNHVAIGTELSHHQAVVSTWDRRQHRQQWQNSENNDDITALDFHPSRPNILLSGGDDGQISIFDTSISEEDDSLLQGVNYGPIHKAGFLGDQRFFALSSDQNMAIHPLSSSGDGQDPQPVILGDLRPSVPCEYVIGVYRSGDQYAIAAGSNISDPRVNIIELQNATDLSQSPNLRGDTMYRLDGGHGEEVVRSLFIDDSTMTVFSAGEDGRIKAFRPSEEAGSLPQKAKISKTKKTSETRYKPY